MRKTCLFVIAVILAAMIMPCASFAADGGLHIVESYPKEDSKSSPPTNLGIKLFFDGNVVDESVIGGNEKCFSLVSENGDKVPLRVLHHENEPKYLLVIAEPEDAVVGLGPNTKYTLNIDGSLKAADGKILGDNKTLSFSTRNTKTDMNVNVAMMVVMVVAMFFFSSMAMRKKAKAEAESDSKVNPYKVAKQTGKSVEEVIEKVEKEKKKSAKRQPPTAGGKPSGAKKAGKLGTDKSPRPGVKRVKGPRPISAGGGTYKSGKKAEAERRAKEEAARRARGTTNPKGTKGKRKK